MKRVVGVASLDADGFGRAEFSNYGWWVDASTVGENVISSFFNFDGPVGGFPHTRRLHRLRGVERHLVRRTTGCGCHRGPRRGPRRFRLSAAAAEILDPTDHPSMPDLGVLVEP